MNIYTGLLFQHGYIQNPELAVSLAQDVDDAGDAGSGSERRRRRSAQGRRARSASARCSPAAQRPDVAAALIRAAPTP